MAHVLRSMREFGATVFILGWRQLRHMRGMLSLVLLGMITAVVLVTAVPAYASLFQSANLRTQLAQGSTLAIATKNPNITITTDYPSASTIAPTTYQQLDTHLSSLMQQHVGPYLRPTHTAWLEFPQLLLGYTVPAHVPQHATLIATSSQALAAELPLLQGSMPAEYSATVDAALSTDVASELHLNVGDTMSVPFTPIATSGKDVPVTLPIHIVGIFQEPTKTTPFFLHTSLAVQRIINNAGAIVDIDYPLLISPEPLLAALQQLLANAGTSGTKLELATQINLTWLFYPDFSRFNINHLDDAVQPFMNLDATINQALAPSADERYTVASTLVGKQSALTTAQAQIHTATFPVAVVVLDTLALLLFFISQIADLLIDQQVATIAIFRSRGISRAQIFLAYLTQSTGLGLLAFMLGLLVTGSVERWLLPAILPGTVVPGLSDLLQSAQDTLWYAAAIALVAIAALWFGIAVALGSDILTLRRETGRPTQQPLWRRFGLDFVLIALLLTTYGIASYVVQITHDPATLQQLTAISLITPTCLVLAGILLCLRVIPWIFTQGARLATRSRGAVAFLALWQLARAPRSGLRMILLLSLSVAFTIFIFVFSASQTTRVQDLAAQQTGADIVGSLKSTAPTSTDVAEPFRHIPGVDSATAGYIDVGNPLVLSGVSLVNIVALDASTYAQTAVWPGNAGNESVSQLMRQLVAGRTQAAITNTIPAVVDTATWNAFQLAPGATFRLGIDGFALPVTLQFVAVAEVPTIPSSNAAEAGILIDYSTFEQVLAHALHQRDAPIRANVIWLRLSDHANKAAIQAALAQDPTQISSNYLDRQAIEAQLQSDPRAQVLVNVLALGTFLPLGLAIIGNLIAIRLQIQHQVVQFSLLRALGMNSRLVRRLLAWELGVLQVGALVLGCLFGDLMAYTLTPSLIFTTTSLDNLDPATVYILQTILPVRIVAPPLVFGVLAFFALCTAGAVALGVTWIQSKVISQTLRLNED